MKYKVAASANLLIDCRLQSFLLTQTHALSLLFHFHFISLFNLLLSLPSLNYSLSTVQLCKFPQCVISKGIVILILILIQTWTSVRTTTTAAVYMTASTYLATTGAPATMDSCWHTMATTVWVRQLGLFKSFSSAYYFVFQAYADGICGFNAHSHSQGTLGTMWGTGLLWLQTGRYPNHASLRDILTCLYTSMVKFWSAWGKNVWMHLWCAKNQFSIYPQSCTCIQLKTGCLFFLITCLISRKVCWCTSAVTPFITPP